MKVAWSGIIHIIAVPGDQQHQHVRSLCGSHKYNFHSLTVLDLSMFPNLFERTLSQVKRKERKKGQLCNFNKMVCVWKEIKGR